MSDERAEATELEMIRKLLVVGLTKLGVSQEQLGAALGMHRTTIARMFPNGLLKDIGKKG